MAIALAVIHRRARVDAMDIEYVVGSALETGPERHRTYTLEDLDFNDYFDPKEIRKLHRLNFTTRPVHMWVLDFAKAASIGLISNDVNKRLALWNSFRETYLMVIRIILASRHERYLVMTLPKLFLNKVVDIIKEHRR
ncbi:hypothetical protein MMC27_007196 [Xylographa pallens]|nr:hypothetical protein [Xylographa pallens]